MIPRSLPHWSWPPQSLCGKAHLSQRLVSQVKAPFPWEGHEIQARRRPGVLSVRPGHWGPLTQLSLALLAAVAPPRIGDLGMWGGREGATDPGAGRAARLRSPAGCRPPTAQSQWGLCRGSTQGGWHSRGGGSRSPRTVPDPGKSLRSWGKKLGALQAASLLLKGTPLHLPLCLLVKIPSHRPILGLFPNWDFNLGSYCFKIRKGW